jgi:division protein CdvB (Snf7/Vps24/ESCRT-III family)
VLSSPTAKGNIDEGEDRRRVINSIRFFSRQAAHLDLSLTRLRALEQDCFSKTIRLIKLGDRVSATVYASEVAYLRRLRQSVKEIRDNITQIILKLESILESKQLTISIGSLVEKLRQIPVGVDALELGQLTNILCDTVASQESAEEKQITDRQVEDVLREAESKASKDYSEPLAA